MLPLHSFHVNHGYATRILEGSVLTLECTIPTCPLPLSHGKDRGHTTNS